MLCITPSVVSFNTEVRNPNQKIDLQVTGNGKDYSANYFLFRYYRPCRISDIFPSSAPAMIGGTQVQLKLEMPESDDVVVWSWMCLFGKYASRANVFSVATGIIEMQCFAPAQSDGMVSVSVTRNEQVSFASIKFFW
jgi:hypothetical protein